MTTRDDDGGRVSARSAAESEPDSTTFARVFSGPSGAGDPLVTPPAPLAAQIQRELRSTAARRTPIPKTAPLPRTLMHDIECNWRAVSARKRVADPNDPMDSFGMYKPAAAVSQTDTVVRLCSPAARPVITIDVESIELGPKKMTTHADILLQKERSGLMHSLSHMFSDPDQQLEAAKQLERQERARPQPADGPVEPQDNWDKLVVYDHWCLDLIHYLRNDTSLILSVLLMSSGHPFTRRMRAWKMVNLVLLNLFIATLIAAYVSLQCPDCSFSACAGCLSSSALCSYCVDNQIGACFASSASAAYISSGSCFNSIVAQSACVSLQLQSTIEAPREARQNCQVIVRSSWTVIGIIVALGLCCVIYANVLEFVLSCSCFVRSCGHDHNAGSRFAEFALRCGSTISIVLGIGSAAFCALAIVVANRFGNSPVTVVSGWAISLLTSEAQGWLISSALFAFLYRRERAAQQDSATTEQSSASNPDAVPLTPNRLFQYFADASQQD